MTVSRPEVMERPSETGGHGAPGGVDPPSSRSSERPSRTGRPVFCAGRIATPRPPEKFLPAVEYPSAIMAAAAPRALAPHVESRSGVDPGARRGRNAEEVCRRSVRFKGSNRRSPPRERPVRSRLPHAAARTAERPRLPRDHPHLPPRAATHGPPGLLIQTFSTGSRPLAPLPERPAARPLLPPSRSRSTGRRG